MVTTNMLKALPDDVLQVMFNQLNELWNNRRIPGWWKDHVLCLAPKTENTEDLQQMRPISLFEITRKVWTGMVVHRIHSIWHQRKALHPAQHGFRWRQGTETAVLRLINTIEATQSDNAMTFLTAWDIRRAFDSVPRNLMRLAWRRLGVDDDTVKWLTALDEDGLTFPLTPFMMGNLQPHSEAALMAGSTHFIAASHLGFKGIRGIGQGDTMSTVAWIAVFDILLDYCSTALEVSSELFAYADDLVNTSRSSSSQQTIANLISSFCAATGLRIATAKVEAIVVNPTQEVPLPQLIIHDQQWIPTALAYVRAPSLRYLGVDIPLVLSDQTAYQWARNYLLTSLHNLSTRRSSPRCKIHVAYSQILPTLLYRTSKASWPPLSSTDSWTNYF